jgi:hypothetical protein
MCRESLKYYSAILFSNSLSSRQYPTGLACSLLCFISKLFASSEPTLTFSSQDNAEVSGSRQSLIILNNNCDSRQSSTIKGGDAKSIDPSVAIFFRKASA